MAPLITEKSCLKCHAKHGYKEGDIRGGISVTLPFIKNIPAKVLMTGHIGIGLVGFLGILIAGMKLDNAYATIKKQAAFDALTGIPNRRSFSERLLGEFQRSKREKYQLSLIMCDIDNFKSYNDTYGHKKGDECLKTVAQVIDNTITRPGDFCARYGGEEFVVILPNTPQKGAFNIAEEIRTNIRNMGIEHLKSLPLKVVSMSLGIATSEVKAPISHDELVSRADKALYHAKGEGRNCVKAFND
jgi:diguanylate cyclase (GGDEF)-like protein